jgi:hypothetical protein
MTLVNFRFSILLVCAAFSAVTSGFHLNIDKDELDRNSSLIENLEITFDKSEVGAFPKLINVSFTELKTRFRLAFVKTSNNSNAALSRASHDIYVIEKTTGQPVKYNIEKEEEVQEKTVQN